MKLTKEQLRKIIKEELKSILEEDPNMPKGRIRRDIEGDGKEMPKGEDGEIDWKKADEMAAEIRLKKPETRLVTKEQLNHIIKEELGQVSPDELTNEQIDAEAERIKTTNDWPADLRDAIESAWKEELNDVQKELLNKRYPGWDKHALERLYNGVTGVSFNLGGEWPDMYQEGKQKMKLTEEQIKRITEDELAKTLKEYGPFGSAMEHSLYQKVISNIQRVSWDETKGLEVRKYVALLEVLENSGYNDEMLSDPKWSPAGIWMDIFGQVEDQKWWDGYKEVDIRFSTPEIEEMCPDCGPIWVQVVKDNGMDGPGYGSEQEPWSDIVDAVKEKNPELYKKAHPSHDSDKF